MSFSDYYGNILSILNFIHFSSVASNNAQVRCNFVDLYNSLFGTKVPYCLAKNEKTLISGLPRIPKIPKFSDTKRSASPFDHILIAKPVVEQPIEIIEREPESVNKPVEVKEEPTDTIKVKTYNKYSIRIYQGDIYSFF